MGLNADDEKMLSKFAYLDRIMEDNDVVALQEVRGLPCDIDTLRHRYRAFDFFFSSHHEQRQRGGAVMGVRKCSRPRPVREEALLAGPLGVAWRF